MSFSHYDVKVLNAQMALRNVEYPLTSKFSFLCRILQTQDPDQSINVLALEGTFLFYLSVEHLNPQLKHQRMCFQQYEIPPQCSCLYMWSFFPWEVKYYLQIAVPSKWTKDADAGKLILNS